MKFFKAKIAGATVLLGQLTVLAAAGGCMSHPPV